MKDQELLKILRSPHVSEKSSLLADQFGQYVFEVTNEATKPRIKRAIEQLFNVKVKMVRITNVKPKAKRFSQREGHRNGWKKAYVSLQEGHKIDLVGAQA